MALGEWVTRAGAQSAGDRRGEQPSQLFLADEAGMALPLMHTAPMSRHFRTPQTEVYLTQQAPHLSAKPLHLTRIRCIGDGHRQAGASCRSSQQLAWRQVRGGLTAALPSAGASSDLRKRTRNHPGLTSSVCSAARTDTRERP